MKVTRSDSQKLVIEDFPYLIGALAFPCALFMLCRFLALLIFDRSQMQEMAGFVIGVLVLFGLGSALTKRSVFEFDLLNRQLLWSRRGVFCRKAGRVSFDKINSVEVQSLRTESGTPTYRVVLATPDGIIPLTDSYAGGENHEKIRAIICEALKKDGGSAAEDAILELAAAGQRIDAIKLAAERYQMSLTEAKKFVDELSPPLPPTASTQP